MASIECLSPEMLVEIFSHYVHDEGHETFLRNVPRVCKHWNELSSDSSLWRDVRAENWNFMLNVSRRGFLYYTQSLWFCSDDDEILSAANLSPVLKNIRDLKTLLFWCNNVRNNAIMTVAEHCPNLERFYLMILEQCGMTSREWDHFLTVCGPTLKHLELEYYNNSEEEEQQLLSNIGSRCPQLENFLFFPDDGQQFPIHELRSGCPNLKELEFRACHLINAGSKDSLDCGFKELKKFNAVASDFGGSDVYSLLKDSIDLEHLELNFNTDFVFGNISVIRSDKVKILKIMLKDPVNNLEALGDAIWKWRRTLSVLELSGLERDISFLFERFLHNNTNPQLETLVIDDYIDPHLFEKFVQKCQNLIHLKIDRHEYEGREKIEEAVEFLMKGGRRTDDSLDID